MQNLNLIFRTLTTLPQHKQQTLTHLSYQTLSPLEATPICFPLLTLTCLVVIKCLRYGMRKNSRNQKSLKKKETSFSKVRVFVVNKIENKYEQAIDMYSESIFCKISP